MKKLLNEWRSYLAEQKSWLTIVEFEGGPAIKMPACVPAGTCRGGQEQHYKSIAAEDLRNYVIKHSSRYPDCGMTTTLNKTREYMIIIC